MGSLYRPGPGAKYIEMPKALRERYQDAHRAYCAAYAAIRNHGVRERVLTDLDCPPLDPRFDPFLRDAFTGRGSHHG